MRFPSDSLRLLAALLLPVLSWADPCIPTPPGLIGWWRGDSPLNAVGPGGGEFRGEARIGPGINDTAFVLNGRHDAVVIPAPFRIPSQDFTIEAWIRRSHPTLTTLDGMAGKALANGTNGLAFGLTHQGQLYLRPIGSNPILSTTSVQDLQWHHVACVRDGARVLFYLDGTLATTAPCTNTFRLDGPYAIGGLGTPLALDSGSPRSFGFLGDIDELAVYDRPLDATTLAALHRAGASGKCPKDLGNRIVNGSFESPHLTAADGIQPGTRTVPVQSLPGWVGPGPNAAVDLELQDFGGTQAAAGVQCLDLEGVPGPEGYVWQQEFVSTPGQIHRLRFAYAKHPEAASSRIRIEISDSDLPALEFVHSTANSRNAPGWVWTEHSFTAKASSTRIRLTGLSSTPGLGMLVDGLSVHEIQFVPIPIQNPGFEDLTGSDPIHFGTDGRLLPLHYSAFPGNMIESLGFHANPAIPGWLGTHTGGTFHPSPDQIPRPSPDGHNVAWINGSGSIFQTLPQVVRGGPLNRLSADLGD
ncbi:MAG: LamG-like jellyroll fold domain-containing protein, partial [Limisphaerales bacterium]